MSMNFLDAAGVLADSAELPLRDLLAHEAKSIVQATVAPTTRLRRNRTNGRTVRNGTRLTPMAFRDGI